MPNIMSYRFIRYRIHKGEKGYFAYIWPSNAAQGRKMQGVFDKRKDCLNMVKIKIDTYFDDRENFSL